MHASLLNRFLAQPWAYFCVSVFYHLLYTLCALDVYYRSPIQDIGGLRPHQSSAPPLAKRLVFVTLDGAPADVVFSAMARDLVSERDGRAARGTPTAPFLAGVLQSEEPVCWGVTHTHVPTESRPGHVSLIAGLYEDPSAVTTGWQHNPNKSFDTVWKEASHVWQWGAPEIVGIFAGAPHVHTSAFPDELNDFAQDPAVLDAWVRRNMSAFFAAAPDDPELLKSLHSERVVFFLHYLGMDSAGHKYGTGGVGYLETLEHVDSCLRDAKSTIDAFYGDTHTAFVITADHGMTQRGSHGDGSPEETRVPLIVFGAGVSSVCRTQPSASSGVRYWQEAFVSEEEEVEYTREHWQRDPATRIDVEPADVSMLMASLLSSPLPVHSEGTVPIEYMSTDRAARAHAMFTNVLQARERVQGAAAVRRSRCRGWFSEWGGAGEAEAMFAALSQHMEGRDYEAVLQRSGGLVELLHEGALYYREYDKALMLAAVAFAYTVWALYSVAVVASETTGITAPQRGFSALPLVLGYALVLPVVHVQGMAWRDACYLLAPCHILPFIWLHSARAWQFLRNTVTSAHTATAAIGVTSVILGFHQRWVFSIAFALLAGGLHCTTQTDTATKLLVILTGAFTLLPCVGSDFLAMVSPAGVVLSLCFYIFLQPHLHTSFRLPWMLWFAAALLTGLTDYIRSVSADGLPLANQAAAWCILLASMALPRLTLHTVPPDHRLAYTLLCLQPPMALLSVGYEPLFLGILSLLLHRTEQVSRQLQLSVSTQAVLLLLLVYYAFFATGNIASVSSFDLPSVYRLQTHFDKGIMGALLIFKLWLPLLALTSTVLFLCRGAVRSVFSVVALTVALSDLVALAFFVTLRNTGSWKQIGHSISRYVIANLLTLILLLLWGIASLYVGTGPKAKRT